MEVFIMIAGFLIGFFLTGVIAKFYVFVCFAFMNLIGGFLFARLKISILPFFLWPMAAWEIFTIIAVVIGNRNSCSLLDLSIQDSYLNAHFDIRNNHLIPTVDKILSIFGLARRSQKNVPVDSCDPHGVFRYIRKGQIPKYQWWFEKMIQLITGVQAKIDEAVETQIIQIANDAQENEGLNSAYLLTFFHLFLDADYYARLRFRSFWVDRIVEGNCDFCPYPDAVLEWVRESYFK